MIINHQHRYVFVAIPKTGSISIQFSLGHQNDIPEPDLYHQSLQEAVSSHPECRDYFKFAMVRNPWARLVSLYFDFTKKRVHQYSGLVRHDTPLFSEFSGFEDFCLRVQQTPWWGNVFLRSQVKSLSLDGKVTMNFIGRFENLADDFKTACRLIDLGDVPLQSHNPGVYDKSSYQQYYSDAAKDAVASLYADDIKEFDYEFDYEF